jgi:hypothetical protein
MAGGVSGIDLAQIDPIYHCRRRSRRQGKDPRRTEPLVLSLRRPVAQDLRYGPLHSDQDTNSSTCISRLCGGAAREFPGFLFLLPRTCASSHSRTRQERGRRINYPGGCDIGGVISDASSCGLSLEPPLTPGNIRQGVREHEHPRPVCKAG